MVDVIDRQERAMSFGSIAENYNELRPQPPQQAVDWLVPAGCQVAVDVGAGTGLFTRTLVDRAGQVIAVEPDARMRTVLTARTPGVRVVEGRGESIPLPISRRRSSRSPGWRPNGSPAGRSARNSSSARIPSNTT